MLRRLFGRTGDDVRRDPALIDLVPLPEPSGIRRATGTAPTPGLSGPVNTPSEYAAPSAAKPAKAAKGKPPPSVRTPPVTRTAPVVLEDHTYAEHARALLAWLREPGVRGRSGEILAPEMLEIYLEMCAEHGWREHCWNPVAHEFTRLTTGEKRYAWILDNGRRRRLRVYPVAGVTESGKVLDLSARMPVPSATAPRGPAGSRNGSRAAQAKRAAA